ncbi:SDR family NAD(P)-dependent oxidoreductase [Roseomonas elaeocarpi]|uniref:SDR family NAD(P)-dependent oxidoreductase n=1 Tax=Roseomonas elaeocarpi TaxID=907779 RepID=A0ABV6JR29_9PROT
MTDRLSGRVAIVTGGSSGIGRAIAARFAREGARVIVADTTEEVREGGVPTEALLRAQGLECRFRRCDVSREEECEAVVAEAVARHGRIDVLVNNAAIASGTPLLDCTREEWERVLAVNLTGTFLMSRAAVRAMVLQDPRGEVRGRLVNLASQHGMVAAPEALAYGTSKAGIAYLTRQVAADYAGQGIVCNAVAPGKILTGKTGRAVEPRWLDYSRARTPWPRLGRPEDVAGAALFLASDDASFLTGEVLMVDGGWMAA